MKSAIEWVFGIIFLLIIALVVIMVETSARKTESEYRAACAKINGTPVFDGRNWDCLK